MTIFEAVKAEVTPRMAAERYGLRVSRSGMVRCLFHDDTTPSMKLYDDHYHCFGCQATGDVIHLTAKLFGVRDQEAARKLVEDFGVRSEKKSILAKLHRFQEQAEQEKLCLRVLRDYLHLLEEWRTKFAPKTPEEAPDDRFVEALLIVDCIEYGTLSRRSFSNYLAQHADDYNLEATNNIRIGNGKRCRGYLGIEILNRPYVG